MRFQFFIYGSFAEGHVHHHKISEFIKEKRAAFIKGEIFRLPSGYPFICTNQAKSLIPGYIADLETPDSFLPVLDQLLSVDMNFPEKNLFWREQVHALIENYTQIPCQIYTVNGMKLPYGSRKLENGEWQKDLRSSPPLHKRLNQKQKEYLSKLAQSKGREVIPIKLDLYRELISLELIVDKGRRLALTSLGREVSLFL